MKLSRHNFAQMPSDIVREKWDCIWIHFQARKSPSPLKSAALQWLDWRMHGALSRHLLNGDPGKTTFIPTMRRIAAPFVALEATVESGWVAFLNNCEGMKIQDLLVFCEDSDQIPSVEKILNEKAFGPSARSKEFPLSVILGSD